MEAQYLKRLIKDPTLRLICSRILEGHRLTLDEAIILMKKAETGILSMLARHIILKRNIRNHKRSILHISLCETCRYNCFICRYSVTGQTGTPLSAAAVERRLSIAGEVDEVMFSAGISGQLSSDYLIDIIRLIRAMNPAAAIRGPRAIHIRELAVCENRQPTDILSKMKEAGLNSLTGADALIFREEMRDKMQDYQFSASQWTAIHKLAHGLGLSSEASMIYGHFESVQDRVDHLQQIRDLQDETQGFDAFIPVKFRAESGIAKMLPPTSPLEDMRVFAIARLFLDNIPHLDVQTLIGEDGWQNVFDFGANRVTLLSPASDNYMPQYGELYIPPR